MLPEVNLLPEYERSGSVLYKVFIISLLLVLLLAGVLTYFFISTNNKLEQTENNITDLRQEKKLMEMKIAELETGGLPSLEVAVEYIEAYRQPTSLLIDEFVKLLPKDGKLSTFSYNYQTVEIQTLLESIKDSSAYLSSLADSKYLEGVVIDQLTGLEYEENEGNLTPPEKYEVDYSMGVKHHRLVEEGRNR